MRRVALAILLAAGVASPPASAFDFSPSDFASRFDRIAARHGVEVSLYQIGCHAAPAEIPGRICDVGGGELIEGAAGAPASSDQANILTLTIGSADDRTFDQLAALAVTAELCSPEASAAERYALISELLREAAAGRRPAAVNMRGVLYRLSSEGGVIRLRVVDER